MEKSVLLEQYLAEKGNQLLKYISTVPHRGATFITPKGLYVWAKNVDHPGLINLIGIDKIGCIHINDSKNPLGSKKDRHENIGYGYIGFDNLINVIYNDKLKNVPKILETPYIGDFPPYKFEIEMIKDKKFNPNLTKDVSEYYKNL